MLRITLAVASLLLLTNGILSLSEASHLVQSSPHSIALGPSDQTASPGQTVSYTVSVSTLQESFSGYVLVTMSQGLAVTGQPLCTYGCGQPGVVTSEAGDQIETAIDIFGEERASFSFQVTVSPTASEGETFGLTAFLLGGVNTAGGSETSYATITVGSMTVSREEPASLPLEPEVSPRPDSPLIKVTKKRCDGRNEFPVFVESHCVDVPSATFTLWDPTDLHAATLTSGEHFAPDESYFGGSFGSPFLWSLVDNSNDRATQGVLVVSCLKSQPESNWHSSVQYVIHGDDSKTVSLSWMLQGGGIPNQAYQPSLDCIWFELPDIDIVPAILSLQVFTSETPYLNWTEPTGPRLEDLMRGESGEDLETAMVMTNTDTGDVYSFAADAYGQVLVPAGTYSLVETANGLEEFFTMQPGQTTLVEVGLAAPAANQSAPPPPAETQTFATGALSCNSAGCSPIEGVTIYYESIDGLVQGSCVTELVETPNGFGSWCDYQYIQGVPTVLTLDELTLPSEMVVTSENPQTYLVPENPDGPLGPVYFQVGPG